MRGLLVFLMLLACINFGENLTSNYVKIQAKREAQMRSTYCGEIVDVRLQAVSDCKRR